MLVNINIAAALWMRTGGEFVQQTQWLTHESTTVSHDTGYHRIQWHRHKIQAV